MATTLTKLLDWTNSSDLGSLQRDAENMLYRINAAFQEGFTGATERLAGGFECVVEREGQSVHILVQKVGEKKYVFDKAYINKKWAIKGFKNFVSLIEAAEAPASSVSDSSVDAKMEINPAPSLEFDEHHTPGLISKWVKEDLAGAGQRHYDRDLSFGAVVDTKMVGADFQPLWQEVVEVVARRASFGSGIEARIEPIDGVQVIKMTFGTITMEREADNLPEAKQLACAMARLLKAWRF